jgi:hypothetical protein
MLCLHLTCQQPLSLMDSCKILKSTQVIKQLYINSTFFFQIQYFQSLRTAANVSMYYESNGKCCLKSSQRRQACKYKYQYRMEGAVRALTRDAQWRCFTARNIPIIGRREECQTEFKQKAEKEE